MQCVSSSLKLHSQSHGARQAGHGGDWEKRKGRGGSSLKRSGSGKWLRWTAAPMVFSGKLRMVVKG
jgi:hypothetical protein